MIFVTTWNGSPDKNQIKAISLLRCHNLPMLVCLNKAGMFEAEHIESRKVSEELCCHASNFAVLSRSAATCCKADS